MLGTRPSQSNLFSADTQYLQFVGEDTFYGFLARHGRELFWDQDFAQFYCPDNGRRSVAPSLLAMALLLQTHDRVSDEEAKQRADFDLRWKVALGVQVDERPFAKSTLQLFRAQLVIHDEARGIFGRSLEYAKQQGYLRSRKLRVALDTTHILGRGAAQDTYNLLAEGIRKLSRQLARAANQRWDCWLEAHGLERFGGASIKGAADVDWESAPSREAFLSGLIGDGQRVLELARQARSELAAESETDGGIARAAELLTALLWQDVEPTERGWKIRQGTAQDRIPAAHDPEQRHGHKSHGKSFTGHKAALAVELDSQLITAVQVIAGNAHDGECAAALVAQSEHHTGAQVEQVIGDTAFGSMQVRQELGEREVIAPTAKAHSRRAVTKADFEIDLQAGVVRCPAGEETGQWTWVGVKGKPHLRAKRFAFAKEVCRACPRYQECVKDKRRRGRFVTLHPDEAGLQAARALERSDYFRQHYRQRVVVEHRIARLAGLGIRQARYFGHPKTRLQLLLASAIANLTLVMAKLRSGPRNRRRRSSFPACASKFALAGAFSRILRALTGLIARLWAIGHLVTDCRRLPHPPRRQTICLLQTAGFRPDF